MHESRARIGRCQAYRAIHRRLDIQRCATITLTQETHISTSCTLDLGQLALKYSEMVTSITSYVHSGTSCVLVGTSVLRPGENEARSGRILVFKAHSETRMFRLESSKSVEGGVASIKQLKQRIIACISYGVCPLSLLRICMWSRLMLFRFIFSIWQRMGWVLATWSPSGSGVT